METQNEQLLSKKERKEIKRQEKLDARETAIQKRRNQRVMNWVIGLILVILPIGGLIWYAVTRPPVPESDIVSHNGLHWHADMNIYVKGVKQDIPAGIGLSGIEMGMHTHDKDNVIHMEYPGLVRKEDLMVSRFFKNWGKDMGSFGTSTKMTVNGKEDTEFGNYEMQDKDKIEIYFD